MIVQNVEFEGKPYVILPREDYDLLTTLAKAVESFSSAVERIEKMAIGSPALLSRMELLPAEKMLAAVDPGPSGRHLPARRRNPSRRRW